MSRFTFTSSGVRTGVVKGFAELRELPRNGAILRYPVMKADKNAYHGKYPW